MRVEVFSGAADSGMIDFTLDDPAALSPDDLLLGIESPDFPFRLVTRDETKVAFAWCGDAEPLFSFEGSRCSFWKRPGWRTAVALLILHRIYRLRRDAIFFHAATVDLAGRGLMIIGPKGMGKSTTALALATRGHALLGDETACYVPATGELEPFRRPVGIKPGPRGRAVDEALLRLRGERPTGIVRVEADLLFAPPAVRRVKLYAIIFLQPFLATPSVVESQACRADLALLQPVSSSMVNATHARRAFELAKMLSASRVFRLAPGDPDATAALIERTLGEL